IAERQARNGLGRTRSGCDQIAVPIRFLWCGQNHPITRLLVTAQKRVYCFRLGDRVPERITSGHGDMYEGDQNRSVWILETWDNMTGHMKIHLVNPSDTAFGTAVITPRWLYVLAAATPSDFGDPLIWDETLDPLDPVKIQAGDVVGIGIHTGNALRGYAVGRLAKQRGGKVIFGGIHATLYPEEALTLGQADSVVKGDGDLAWGAALVDCRDGSVRKIYEGGKVEAEAFKRARWDLLPKDR